MKRTPGCIAGAVLALLLLWSVAGCGEKTHPVDFSSRPTDQRPTGANDAPKGDRMAPQSDSSAPPGGAGGGAMGGAMGGAQGGAGQPNNLAR